MHVGDAGGGGGGSSGSGGGSSVGGGLQVYPPPTTPPEPAPPDRDSIEGSVMGGHNTRRLVKATTLPAPTFHSAASRTSLEDLTCNYSLFSSLLFHFFLNSISVIVSFLFELHFCYCCVNSAPLVSFDLEVRNSLRLGGCVLSQLLKKVCIFIIRAATLYILFFKWVEFLIYCWYYGCFILISVIRINEV